MRGGSSIRQDMAIFTRQLATMMKSACPSTTSSRRGNPNPRVTKLLSDRCRSLELLTERRFAVPARTDATAIWSERWSAGILDALLDRLAVYMEDRPIKVKIKSALSVTVLIVGIRRGGGHHDLH
jgi:type IV pilus assembly protein PilC